MEIDRRAFIGSLGGVAAVQAVSPSARAEALEHYMIEQLNSSEAINEEEDNVNLPFYDPERPVPRGAGRLFAENKNLKPMPAKPTLVDFFELRFAPARHVLQSAARAIKTGQPERTVLACLLHDTVLNLMKPDHGWWGAQLYEPYVDERVSWGIRYHQGPPLLPRSRSRLRISRFL